MPVLVLAVLLVAVVAAMGVAALAGRVVRRYPHAFTGPVASGLRSLADVPPGQWAQRLGIMALALTAVGLLDQPWTTPAGVACAIALMSAVVAMIFPDSAAPAVFLAAVGVAWLYASGRGEPPGGWRTLAVAAALFGVHSLAALSAASPATAPVDRATLLRWLRHTGLTLVLVTPLAGAVYGLGQPRGSLPLVLAGLAGVVVVIAVPVWLARR
jgi:hypothetical protein